MNKLIKTIFPAIVLFLFAQTSYSQENFQKGIVIGQNKDTLSGFIDYRNWDINPEKIKFKKTLTSQSILFKPESIRSFSVNNELYTSAIVETEVTSTAIVMLDTDPNYKIEIDTAFLQTLVLGPKSLLFYKTKKGKENFYISENEQFTLLRFKKYIRKNENGNSVSTEKKTFAGQLMLYLSECQKLQGKIQITKYSKPALAKLFKSYYDCTGDQIQFDKTPEGIEVQFGVLAGSSVTKLGFETGSAIMRNKYRFLEDANFHTSPSVSGGVYFNIVIPRNFKKWSVYNQITYSSYTAVGEYYYERSEFNYSTTTTEIGSSNIKINNMIRFTYPVKKFHLFSAAGLSNVFVLGERNYKRVDGMFFGGEISGDGVALDETKKHEIGYVLSIGVAIGKVHLEVRQERGIGMSKYYRLDSSTKSTSLQLGFRF